MSKFDYKKLIDTFKGAKGVQFVAFPYRDADNELTKRIININASYTNALRKDVQLLQELSVEAEIDKQAKSELLKSNLLSLKKQLSNDLMYAENQSETDEVNTELNGLNALMTSLGITAKETEQHGNRSTGQGETYIYIGKSIKWHAELQKLYIWGMSVKKTVVEAVEKVDTRKPLTKAKDNIRKQMHSTKFRNFVVENLEGDIKVNGDTIELS